MVGERAQGCAGGLTLSEEAMGILDRKVVLITGTGGGLGRVAAQTFAREGAKVVGCDIKVDANNETVELVRRAGGEMTTMTTDAGSRFQSSRARRPAR